MKPERFHKTKSVVASSAIALVVAAATFGLTSVVVGQRNAPEHLGFALTGGSPCPPASPGFCINQGGGNTISSTAYPATFTPAVLAPGAHDYLWYNVYNPLSVSISVTSLSIQTVTAPAGCSATNLDTSSTGFSAPASPAASDFVVTSKHTGTVSVPISFNDLPLTNQSDTSSATYNCENKTFTFTFTGSAQYAEVYNTSTVVNSSLNPSTEGQSVTYTATVTASPTTTQDPAPTSPTGTVTFTDNGTTICNAVPVTSTGTAPCTISYASTSGSPHSIMASYMDGSDNNFNGSSGTLTQRVNPKIGTTTALTSTPNPSTSGQSVTFTATVTKASGTGTPTGNVSFYSGTPTGSHTLLITKTVTGGGATYATSSAPPLSLGTDPFYAVYSGDTNFATSTSPVYDQRVTSAACINGTTNGGYTVASGKFVCITGRLNGGITVKSGGSLFLNGATVNGGIVSTGAVLFTSCGSSINGNVTISGSTGPVLIGDGGDNQPAGDDPLPACAGNTINAATISITSDTGSVEFGGNTVIGLISITNNAGPEVEGNEITGTLTCSGNAPLPTNDGPKNTGVVVKLLQCAGSLF